MRIKWPRRRLALDYGFTLRDANKHFHEIIEQKHGELTEQEEDDKENDRQDFLQ